MVTWKKKIGSSSGVIKPENRLLRLLRLGSHTGFQPSLISLERTDQEDNNSAYAQKEIDNALLDAEYKKAQAIMMMQQHQNPY